MRFATPAAFSTEPTLDAQVLSGFDAWIEAARELGPIRVTQWLERRSIGSDFPFHMVFGAIERLLKQSVPIDPGVGTSVCSELAEKLLAGDPEMAEMVLRPVIRWARDRDDAELLMQAGSTATEILNSFDEPQAVGRIWIDVLNWTRQPGHKTSVELIQHAFEQVIAAAERDGAQLYAARLEFEQVQFHRRFGEQENVTADWRTDAAAFEPWFSDT
jgi:hypothetical protein